MVKIVSNYVRMSVMCHLCLQLTENVVFYLYKTYVWITFFYTVKITFLFHI